MCRIRTDARVRNRRRTLCEAASHMGSERHPEHASALPVPRVWCVGKLDGHWSLRNPRAMAYTSLAGVAVPNGDDILLPVCILVIFSRYLHHLPYYSDKHGDQVGGQEGLRCGRPVTERAARPDAVVRLPVILSTLSELSCAAVCRLIQGRSPGIPQSFVAIAYHA